MPKVLFIHRSVGKHLLRYGRLRSLLNAQGVSLDDYNNNEGLLTRNDGSTVSNAIEMSDNNTNPDNLAKFFKSWPNILNGYDVVVIKSCYPNSHVKDAAQLETIKASYTSIIDSFNKRSRSLLMLTTPPLRPLFTNQTEAKLANELADWLVLQTQGNIHVFDLHHLYAADSGRHVGMLKLKYRRLLPWDNHPNRWAHRVAGPKIVDMMSI